MKRFHIGLYLLFVMLLCGCTSVTDGDVANSLCHMDQGAIGGGLHVRTRAIYSPSSMHGDVLYEDACPSKRVKTYGYNEASGGVSDRFRKAVEGDVLSISVVKYEVDVSGIIEKDDQGLWLKALTVHDYRRLRSEGEQ